MAWPMVKPDIILSWPNNCDYPLWRDFITKERARFNEVIIAITETNQAPNYTDFIREQLTPLHCQFVIPPPTPPTDDWRNIATRQCLLHSYNADWIWFTEQDFIITDVEAFFAEVQEAENKGFEIMATYQETRMHPCDIFIKRSLLDKTRKQFGIIPNVADHFIKFQQDIEAIQSPVYHLDKHYKHLNGLSSNMSLIARGEAPNHQPKELKQWLFDCFKANVTKDSRWVAIYENWLFRPIEE